MYLPIHPLLDRMSLILIVEDEPRLLGSIVRTLEESGYATLAAETLAAASRQFSDQVDLVLLDIMLPDGSGVDWLAAVRGDGNSVAVLMLTARDAVEDRVRGLDTGADDYLVKPFSWDELLARIRALLRRGPQSETTLLKFGPITVDLLLRQAYRDGNELELQNRQLEILIYLMRHGNEIVTREMVARDVWKEPTATWTNVIQVHINHLRKVLEAPGLTTILHTIRGQGYLLGDPPC
ncbi:two-component response regulator [Blastopirellula marina DSM 3645]|uniref:Two-component response regulator n=2 Tax=Blastopirellula marina TaxID=124 RepID=A3ZX60_9BACT|nr:two-component response regulator [Blastopirellula marina DSM 3645]